MGKLTDNIKKYPDMPRSVTLKMELQRIGVKFTEATLESVKNERLNFKGEFMFSYDHFQRKTLQHKIPFQFMFRRDDTYIQTKTNEASPYLIDYVNGKFYLREGEEMIEEVFFTEEPVYYSMKTSDGVRMSSVIQSIGDSVFCTITKFCEYWSENLQCKFCDFGSVTKDQLKTGEIGVMYRTIEQVAETLECVQAEGKWRHLIFSGGAVISKFRGMDELDYFCDFLSRVLKRAGAWCGSGIQICPPKDKDGWKKIRDTGISSVQPNMEVWDRRLFDLICPGKAKYVGRDEWLRRLIEGVDVFGPGRIIPNFVIGVEMSKPWGFTDVDEAVLSTLGGFDYLMQNGVFPRCAEWFVEPGSALGDQDSAPFEYYAKFAKGYRALRHKYGFGDRLVCLCRRCNSQDTLHDWDYADFVNKAEEARKTPDK